MPAPFVINAEYENLTRKINGLGLDPSKNNTQKTKNHEACGWGHVVGDAMVTQSRLRDIEVPTR